MKLNYTNFFGITFSITILTISITAGNAFAGGSDCRTGASVKVCVEWSQGIQPFHGFDYTVDFSDASNPDVELQTGDDWIVYAELVSNGQLANLGHVTTTDSNDYTVKISRSGNAGAVNVASLVLEPDGDNHSSIESGSRITGDLGDFTLVKDGSNNGGSVDGFTISGDLLGNVDIAEGAGFTVDGKIGPSSGSKVAFTVGAITTGTLTIGSVDHADILVDDEIDAGSLVINGGLDDGATITIDGLANSSGTSPVVIGATATPPLDFENALWIKDEVPSGATIDLSNLDMEESSTVIINGGLNGTIEVYSTSAGSSDMLVYGLVSQVGGSGLILVENDHNGGKLIFPSGTVRVNGDMGADATASTTSGEVEVNGTTADGEIILGATGTADVNANLDGDINVDGSFSGTIDIDGNTGASSVIDIDEHMTSSGAIHITGNVSGDIKIGSDTGAGDRDLEGLIDIDGALIDGARIEIAYIA